tara:strand:- start:560 stop:847 length:288 start_codon:yes stop_codon:yes gene_type:complete
MNKDTTIEKGAGFTPGPWMVKYDKHGYPYVGVESDPHTYQGTIATVEQRKDARLIASAPELYDMLVKISQGNGHDTLTLAMEARELLAKVDGGEG